MNHQIQEYWGLVESSTLERSPAVRKFILEMVEVLPKNFSIPRFIPAPPNQEYLSVLRSECTNQACSVRAILHLQRDLNLKLVVKERDGQGKMKPDFDRTTKLCHECRRMLVKQMKMEG